NINDDATVPKVEEPSWLRLNSYRQNTLVQACRGGGPDLTASYVRAEETDTEIHWTVRVGNGGGTGVGPGVPISFYDGEPSLGKKRATGVTTGIIPAGGFEDVTVTVPIDTSALPLWVAADDQGGL